MAVVSLSTRGGEGSLLETSFTVHEQAANMEVEAKKSAQNSDKIQFLPRTRRLKGQNKCSDERFTFPNEILKRILRVDYIPHIF